VPAVSKAGNSSPPTQCALKKPALQPRNYSPEMTELSFAQVVANGVKLEEPYNFTYSVAPTALLEQKKDKITQERTAGILIHPSSFPSNHGIGDFGSEARKFVDWMRRAGQTLWQILPLTPPAAGNSPYSSLSTFAGNVLLISLEDLVHDGLILENDLEWLDGLKYLSNKGNVDFEKVLSIKGAAMEKTAHSIRLNCRDASTTGPFVQFWKSFETYQRENDALWLHDYALFTELKRVYNGDGWSRWEAPFRNRDKQQLAEFSQRHHERLTEIKILQFIFAKQWQALKSYAHARDIRIMGDIPIFVSHDSADVWSNKSLFCLDKFGLPTVVAGVPPDYFSETGQLWGNPLYDWPVHMNQGFKWWLDRFSKTLEAVDLIRLDHFRGFESYWEVAADAKTAIHGKWIPAPGRELFEALTKAYGGKAPIIAEDLGIITHEVVRSFVQG
jgi:4-alpha-glucanotransferase